jgi:hypothetical protein
MAGSEAGHGEQKKMPAKRVALELKPARGDQLDTKSF